MKVPKKSWQIIIIFVSVINLPTMVESFDAKIVREQGSILEGQFWKLNDHFTIPGDNCNIYKAYKNRRNNQCYCFRSTETFISYKTGCTTNTSLIEGGKIFQDFFFKTIEQLNRFYANGK